MASSASLAKNNTPGAPEKPMLRRRRGPRCQLCKRQHQKCRFTHEREVCDRCLNLGYECRLMVRTERRPTPPVRAPRAKRGSNIFKCDACRQHHQKCEPEDRVWPARCIRCIKQKQPCGPPHDALGRNIPYIRSSGDGDDCGDVGQGVEGSGSLKPWLGPSVVRDHAEAAAAAAAAACIPPLSTAPESETSSGSSSEKASISISTRLRAAWEDRVEEEEEEEEEEASPRPIIGKQSPTHMVSGETIRRMEDEFHDVLRQLERKHVQELKTQKHKYEEELGVQRDRYERRLDDLIRIMRHMGQDH